MGACAAKKEHAESDTDNCKPTNLLFDNNEMKNGKKVFYDTTAEQIINAFIHYGNDCFYDIFIPKDIMWMISTYHLQSIIIEQGTICTLQSGQEYNFDSFILNEWSMLTVDEYNKNIKEGGILCLKCDHFIMKKGASINLNGKGYFPTYPHEINIVNGGYNKHILDKYGMQCGDGYHHCGVDASLSIIDSKCLQCANITNYHRGNKDVQYKNGNYQIWDWTFQQYIKYCINNTGRGGGAIYIECNKFNCDKQTYILAKGDKGYMEATKRLRGHDGNIKIFAVEIHQSYVNIIPSTEIMTLQKL
eukprot:536488_1